MARKPHNQEYTRYIHSDRWRARRLEAFAHYGRLCANCASRKNLHVHHKSYAHFGDELLSELQVLCEECHFAFHALLTKPGDSAWPKRVRKPKPKRKRKRRKTAPTPKRKSRPEPSTADLLKRMNVQKQRARTLRR